MAKEELARIDNTRPTLVGLPTGPGVLADTALPPGGGKNVPQSYLDYLGSTEAPEGVKAYWGGLLKQGWVRVTPASAPEAKTATKRPEVPQPPADLSTLGEAGAMALVRAEDSLDTLVTWFANERRPEIRVAINARAKALGHESLTGV
jgi:hypothetical protein